MSFDTWIHILEGTLVAGIFGVSWWVLKVSRRGAPPKRKSDDS
jgi:hypothetical protein